jgi:hypothetical protein
MNEVEDSQSRDEMSQALRETYSVAHALLTGNVVHFPVAPPLEILCDLVRTLLLYSQVSLLDQVDTDRQVLKELSESVDDLFVGVDNCVRRSGWSLRRTPPV